MSYTNPNNNICPGCGAAVPNGSTVCGNCGRQMSRAAQPQYSQPVYQQPQQPQYGQPVYQQPQYGQPVYQQPAYQPPAPAAINSGAPVGQVVSKTEFAKHYASASIRKEIKTMSIISYVLAAINILATMGILFSSGLFSILDIIIPLAFVGCTIGLQVTHNKLFAIGMMVVAIVNMLLIIIINQSFGGWWWALCGVCMVNSLNKIDKEYSTYLANNGQRI